MVASMPVRLAAQVKVDRMSMRRYMRAIHRDDKDDRGYIVWSERRHRSDKSYWKQQGYPLSTLVAHATKIAAETHKDIYISLQTFYTPRRLADKLWRLNAIAFDIDEHTKGLTADEIKGTVNRTLAILERDVFDKDVLPHPSMIVSTGRGLQVLYLLESLPRQGLPLWKLTGESMADRISDCLDAYKGVTGTLDPNYGDVTRVLRVPGTYNYTARQYAYIIEPPADVELVYYRLDTLRDRFLPELIIDKKNKTDGKKKKANASVVRLFNTYSLHVARLEDIVKLRELRQASDVPEDYRRRMIFLYRYWSCFCVGEEAALEAALDFNEGFRQPLPPSIVKNDTKSAEKAYEDWKADHKRGYNYKNETLIELLGITTEEQQFMQTIIGHDEKMRRMKTRNWDHSKRDEVRASARIERDNEIMELIRKGVSRREICNIKGVSPNTISKVYRANMDRNKM